MFEYELNSTGNLQFYIVLGKYLSFWANQATKVSSNNTTFFLLLYSVIIYYLILSSRLFKVFFLE